MSPLPVVTNPDSTEDRCHIWQGVHIPGCLGCATYGHRYCTCDPSGRVSDDTRALKRRVAELERRIEELEEGEPEP